NNTFYTPSEYANRGNNQQSSIFTDELLGLSLDDVELVGDSQDTPQWAMDGFDSSNSQESPYAGISNGVIAWNYTGNVFSSLSIDKDGRIILVNNGHLLYLYTNGTVYAEPLIALDDGSINPSRFFSIENYSISPNNYFTIITEDNGNYLLNFAETDKSISSSGTTTYLGFKKWADTMPVNNVPLFVDKNDGKVHFLCFFPDDLLVMFDFNEIIRDPYSEPYEGYGLISSTRTPTVTESGIWVPTSDGIVVFDLKNFGEEAAPIKTISASVSSRPVADANGNVYFFTSNSISKADSTNGVTKTQAVTGGTGSRMAISTTNNALYSVNSLGTLYKYSLDDLTESEVYDIGTPASTIMTDASGVIYVGTTDGKFYAISDAGEELWSVDTESGSEVKNCAMDNEGNIYFYTAENKVYAINEAPEPQIPEISGGAVVYVENTTLGEGDGKIMMYFYGDNGPVDGSVDVYFNDTKYNAVIGNGVAILNAGSELSCGIYDIYYEYLGGTNYASSSKVKTDSKFEVGKRDVNITYEVFLYGWYGEIEIKFLDDVVTPKGQFSSKIDNGWTFKRNVGSPVDIDSELENGTHTITINYLGDANHNPKTVVGTFDIIKRQPTCNVTRDGGKFKFDFTEEVGDGAIVSVDFEGPNSFSEGLGWTESDGTASVDVSSKLLNGSYNLTIHFESYSMSFVSADFNYTFDYIKYTISNMTVIPEVPTKPIGTTSTITVVVNVAEGDPVPTGSVSFKAGSATFSASLNENGIAKVRWETWQDQVGSFVRTFTYSGDKNYETASMDVTLVCEPSLNVKLQTENNNVTFSFNDDYNYDNYGVVHIIDNGEYLGNVTGDGSFPNFKASDLDLGEHTFEIIWENTDGHNYTFTESAFLRISGTPQWANTGFDIKNGGNPDYTRLDNVYIIWSNNESINITKYPNNYRREYTGEMSYIYGGVTSYSPIIASDGIIYLNDGYVIYAYDSEGNVLYTKAPGRVVPGLSIYNDTIVIAPRTDEEVVTYDFFTGNSYTGGTNWVSSSFYYPIVGPDGRIYISSEFYNNNGKWITVLSLNNENKFSWNAAYIDTEAIATPVFDDEGNMWVATENGIRAVNIYSEANVFSDSSISINARPAVSESNIVFYLSKETENSIYALTAEGYLWNTTVSGTVGTTLAIDNENGFVYSVNKEGKLYKYDINDGTETFVYDLGAKAKSIIVDGDSKVYVGDTNGYVTALDSEGNLLWTINLGAPIAGGLAMNNEGIIYAYTNDTLFALGYRDPISIEVSIPEGNYTVLDEVTITATLNETVEGTVTFTAGDLIQVVAVNGTTAEWTTALPAGEQTVTATFEGDGYVTATGTATVNIAKVDAEITADVVSSIKKTTITLTLPKNATGKVSVKVNGKSYSTEVEGGTAVITITDLKSGKYTAEVTYGGDDNYNNASFEVAINVPYKENLTISASADPIVVGEDAVIVVSGLKDATGNVTVSVNGKTYAAP
ncbi:MAG: Ig-like domain repeat protein, partial [Methanobrevibacter sp.]|nr:Ig-like domain repeat protein [Methanobrevibacter sp.]